MSVGRGGERENPEEERMEGRGGESRERPVRMASRIGRNNEEHSAGHSDDREQAGMTEV